MVRLVVEAAEAVLPIEGEGVLDASTLSSFVV